MKALIFSLVCLLTIQVHADTKKPAVKKPVAKTVSTKAPQKDRKVASDLQEIMQAEVSDDAVGVCHVRLVREDLSLEAFEGPELVKEACYKYGRSLLKESDNTFMMVLVKHNGIIKQFDRK